ncbi:MAG: rhodanese-like domain-containing protein [Alphaproteobacteria bacterium]
MKEVTPQEAFAALSADETAILVDCRSRAEWIYTGTPDLSSIGKKVVFETLVDETGQPNEAFVAQISEVATPQTSIFVICRVGGRSANACQLLAANGYSNLHNVTEGFEGGVDEHGHRASFEGWKFHQLPWCQS